MNDFDEWWMIWVARFIVFGIPALIAFAFLAFILIGGSL